ncbi:MAG TPA: hypothetical protein VGY56_01395 [Verrucomicrobiae bacterium]|nr:hypothetical protein [Verrucomicrobiae bacterium]
MMIKYVTEIYLTGFAIFFKFRPDQKASTRAGRATTVVTFFLWIALLALLGLIEMISGRQFLKQVPKLTIVVVWIGLYLINMHFLYLRGYGIRFEQEFDKLDKSAKNLLIWRFIVSVLVVITFSILLFMAHNHFIHANAP